jgi:hypothetical protein
MKLVQDKRLNKMMIYPIGSNMENVSEYTKVFAELIDANAPKGAFIHFLCRGSSGAILSGAVSTLLPLRNSTISHIKKDGESSHNWSNHFPKEHYYIIIDDFISSGRTVDSIHQAYLNSCHIGCNVNMLVVSAGVTGSLNCINELDVLICGKFFSPGYSHEKIVEQVIFESDNLEIMDDILL